MIALRSVTLPTHPPTEDYTRGEVLCAGFTIWEESSTVTKVGQMGRACSSACMHTKTHYCTFNSSQRQIQSKIIHKMQRFTARYVTCFVLFQITYYNQATPGVLPYISTDIAGLSSSFYSVFSACSHFLEANKDSPAALHCDTHGAAVVSLQEE